MEQSTRPCRVCGKDIPRPSGRGAWAKSCSDECRRAYEKARQLRRYAENPEYFKENARRWQAANRERYRARKRQHHLENPHLVQGRNRRHYEANREQRMEYQRCRRVQELAMDAVQLDSALLRTKLVYWGSRCWMCGGEPTGWDHVKPLSKGGAHILANLRPACSRCNSRKNNRWPYKTDIRRECRE